MSLLQDEQLEALEGQGRRSQIYKAEFFLTVLACTVLATVVLAQYVPEGQSSIPIVLEALSFSIVLALLSSQWAGRLIAVIFALACWTFVAVKIVSFGNPSLTNYTTSFYLWVIGASVFLLILVVWKVFSYINPDNIEAREYEKEMRRLGKW